MNQKKDTHNHVLEYFAENSFVRPGIMSQDLGISRVSIHKVLKALLTQGRVRKFGSTPWIVYIYNNKWQPPVGPEMPQYLKKHLPPSILE